MSRMLEGVRKGRNMPWLRRGMSVDVNGEMGTVTGGNASMNIQVRFAGRRSSCNCHPTWRTTYFQDGNIIADYKQQPAQEPNMRDRKHEEKETRPDE